MSDAPINFLHWFQPNIFPFYDLKRNYCFILEFHWEENFSYSCSVLLEAHVAPFCAITLVPPTVITALVRTLCSQWECLQGRTLATWKWTALFLVLIGAQAFLFLHFPQNCRIGITKPDFLIWFIKMEHESIKLQTTLKFLSANLLLMLLILFIWKKLLNIKMQNPKTSQYYFNQDLVCWPKHLNQLAFRMMREILQRAFVDRCLSEKSVSFIWSRRLLFNDRLHCWSSFTPEF